MLRAIAAALVTYGVVGGVLWAARYQHWSDLGVFIVGGMMVMVGYLVVRGLVDGPRGSS